MSLIGTMLAFLTGLFGVAYAGATIMIAQEPAGGSAIGQPPSGGTGSFSGPSGGTGSFGGPSGDSGSFGGPSGGSGGQFGGPGGGGQFPGQGSTGGQFPGQGSTGGQFPGGGKDFGNQQKFGGQGQGGQQGGQRGQQGGQRGQQGGQQQFDGQQGGQQGGQNGESGQDQFSGGQNGEGGQRGGEMDEKQQQKQEEEQNKQCLKQMQKGVGQMARPVKELEGKIAKIKKQGATPPASAQEAVDKMKASLQAVKDAKTCDDAQAAQEELSGQMQDMQDLFQQLEFAAQAPKITKQIKQGYKMLDQMWNRALANAKKSKVDLSEQVARGQAIHDELKAMFDQMIAAVNSGDFEVMQNMMEAGDAAEEKRGEMEDVIQTIDAVRNTGQMIKGLNQHLAGLKRGVSQAKRQKKDVTEINACVAAGKVAVDAVKAAAAAKPVNLDTLVDAFEGANDTLGQCDDLIGAATGQEQEGLFDDFFGGDMQKQIQSRPRQQQGGGEGGQTCNVNGVEVPGPCSQVEGGGGGGFGGF